MCRLALLGALLLPLASPAGAQTPAARELARVSARSDSLLRAWREASALADMAARLAHQERPPELDTLEAGGLRVIVNPSRLPAEAAARLAWRSLDSLFGTAAARLAATPLQLLAVPPDSVRLARPMAYAGQRLPEDLPADELAVRLLTLVPLPQPSARFSEWLGRSVPALPHVGEAGHVYTDLVTSPYAVAQGCIRGDLAACRSALDLEEGPDPVAWRFHDAVERRYAARHLASFFEDEQQGNPGLYRDCQAGTDSACRRLLSGAPASLLARPLGTPSRLELVWLALRIGGRGGYARLLDAGPVPPAAALAAAAGLPADSLLALWRQQAVASRPPRVTVTPLGVLAALGWLALFATSALRSSRWRTT